MGETQIMFVLRKLCWQLATTRPVSFHIHIYQINTSCRQFIYRGNVSFQRFLLRKRQYILNGWLYRIAFSIRMPCGSASPCSLNIIYCKQISIFTTFCGYSVMNPTVLHYKNRCLSLFNSTYFVKWFIRYD